MSGPNSDFQCMHLYEVLLFLDSLVGGKKQTLPARDKAAIPYGTHGSECCLLCNALYLLAAHSFLWGMVKWIQGYNPSLGWAYITAELHKA